MLVRRLRAAWPRTKIVLRANSGFCRDRMLPRCDQNNVKYVVGVARNVRLLEANAVLMKKTEEKFNRTGKKQRLFTAFDYAARYWKRPCWVIAKAEHTEKGANPRFIRTNVVGDPQKIYNQSYCARAGHGEPGERADDALRRPGERPPLVGESAASARIRASIYP